MVRRAVLRSAVLMLLLLDAASVRAIDVKIDYTYAAGFFAPGSAARQTLEHVANFYSNILEDTFSPIVTPAPFMSALPPFQNPGTVEWHWTMNFSNPSGAGQITRTDQTLAADEYRLYVGAKSLSDNTLGEGGPGGSSVQPSSNGGNFTQAEIDQINLIDANFKAAVSKRGEASGFGRWGGSVTFDSDPDNNWHFDHTTLPAAGESDFLSVAVHEIGHALGLGSSTDWDNLTAGNGSDAYFFGPAAIANYGSQVPLAFEMVGGNPFADKGHWREDTMSTIFGSAIPQETVMSPSVTQGTRKRLTTLDAAALTDIGWTVAQPDLLGDFNHDNVVDAADYTVWRDGLGSAYTADDYTDWKANFGQTGGAGTGSATAAVPEPGAAILAFAAIFLALAPPRSAFPGTNPRGRLS